jgi:hypothetical protein
MGAFLYFLAVLLLPSPETGRTLPRGTGSVRPLSLGEGTSVPGAKSDALSAAAVRKGLREGGFPWYDSEADRVRPVWAPRMSWLKSLRERLDRVMDAIDRFFESLGFGNSRGGGIRGDWLGTILLATVLAAFFVFLLVLWMRREPLASAGSAARAKPGSAELLAQLAGDSALALDDPWAEAQRRRLAGDMAGAIIYLFAHQLISLDRAGLIRLAPGWTGRQYVRWLRDPVLVDSLAATLGLFEEIYYGHRLPSRGAFEQVWHRAQALEDRRDELERSR